MTIQINGEPREFEQVRTVADLVGTLALPVASLLIEHNGTALRREEWDAAELGEGDNVEVLRIAAGG